MGLKTIKQRYKTEGMIIHVVGEDVAFGTPLAPTVLLVSPRGEILQSAASLRMKCYDDIEERLRQDPNEFVRCLEAEEEYGDLQTVFSFKNGKIVEQQTDNIGWPNTTIDGELMYENSHFETRAACIENAKANLKAAVRSGIERVRRLSDDLAREEKSLCQSWEQLETLNEQESA